MIASVAIVSLLFHSARAFSIASLCADPCRHSSLKRYTTGASGDDGVESHTFAGGKMAHLFEMERDWDKHNPKQWRYTESFTSDSAREALENSNKFYWKVDGSCGVVTYDVTGKELSLYQRIDTRGKVPPSTLVALPDGKNPVMYGTTDKPHTYFMEKVVLAESDGKNQRENKRSLLDVLERNKDALVELILSNSVESDDLPFLSVELVGTKYNKTPGVQAPVALAPHCLQRISAEDTAYLPGSFPRSFDELKLFLLDSGIVAEGIIVEHKEMYWKVHSKLFEPGCMFAKEKSKANLPFSSSEIVESSFIYLSKIKYN